MAPSFPRDSPRASPEVCPVEKPSGGPWPEVAEWAPSALARIVSDLRLESGESGVAGLPTGFESICAPAISVEDYLTRLMKYFKCGPSCLVLASVYIHRLLDTKPDFVLGELTVHRLILAALTVAAKVHDDTYHPNSWYAKAGGITNQELNILEAELLGLLEWRVRVTAEVFERHQLHLIVAAGLPVEAPIAPKEACEACKEVMQSGPHLAAIVVA